VTRFTAIKIGATIDVAIDAAIGAKLLQQSKPVVYKLGASGL
jgi:hypothetical protein